jgi:AmiR/NasT family two-component response regulator
MTNDPLDFGDYVHQATGMVAAQLDCDTTEALGRLRIRAVATSQALEDLALDVLDGMVRFS